MRGQAVWSLGLVPILLLALPGAEAQSGAEGWVELEFLEDEVTIRSGENATVPLQARAEIQCDGVHAPPESVRFSGRYGVAWHAPGGAYYATHVDPPMVPFDRVGSGLPGVPGPVVYRIDMQATLRIETEVSVVEPIDHAVMYSTVGYYSMEGCTAAGWKMPSAERAAFHLYVLPPLMTDDGSRSEESPSLDAALALVLLGAAIAVAGYRRTA